MAAPLKLAINCQKQFRPLAAHVRHGHHFKTKNPRLKPVERRVFDEVTKPIYPEPFRHPAETCGKKQQPTAVFEKNRYEEFLIKQLKKQIESSEMIIVCHPLPFSGVRQRQIFVALKKEGLKLTISNNKHMLRIIESTKLEKMAPLFIGTNLLITSPEPRPVELMKVLKKFPEMIVLGGFLEDRLVLKNHLQDIVKLPSIEQLRGELVSCLNMMAGGKTLSLLNSHQTNLSNNLQQYVKQSQESETTTE